MATIDIRPYNDNRLKKSISLSTATIDVAKIGANYGNPNPGQLKQGDVLNLFEIPPRSVVTAVFMIVKTKATATTATVKVDVGSTALMAAVAGGSTSGAVVGSLAGTAKGVYLPTGGIATATVGVADLVDGEFEVVVEYYEVGKFTGELTN